MRLVVCCLARQSICVIDEKFSEMQSKRVKVNCYLGFNRRTSVTSQVFAMVEGKTDCLSLIAISV